MPGRWVHWTIVCFRLAHVPIGYLEFFEVPFLLERAERNPFLPRFYRNSEEVALPARPICARLRRRFSAAKDRIFAELALNRDELELYYRICELLAPRVATSDLAICLQAPGGNLLERIEHRGIEYELPINPSYLKAVDAYVGFFHAHQEAPLLIVNKHVRDESRARAAGLRFVA